MRNLTLGVLIVTGGTLAALPFRRSPAIPDASLHANPDAVQATGPLQSALEIAPVQVADLQSDRPVVHSFSHQEIPGLSEFMGEQDPSQDLVAAAPRRSEYAAKPLTYEDLMAPIVRPQSVQDRFQAIASVRDAAVDPRQPDPPTVVRSETDMTNDVAHSRQQAHSLQRDQSLGFEFEERFTSVDVATENRSATSTRAAGTLASSLRTDAPEIPRLPDASAQNTLPVRHRHWIVQP